MIMSKGAILTCGYFSLDNVIKGLFDIGYNLVKIGKHGESIYPELQDHYNVETDLWSECVDNVCEELDTKVLTAPFNLIAVGGVPLGTNRFLLDAVVSEIMSGVASINAAQAYLIDAHKKHSFKAMLLHMSEGAKYRTLMEVGKDLGIPSFCSYNGISTDYLPMYNAHQFYNVADYYYLPGDCTIDWLGKRKQPYTKENMILAGHPGFDKYYKDGKIPHSSNMDEDLFLYSPATILSEVALSDDSLTMVVDLTDFSLVHSATPYGVDIAFFRAFAKYQREVNPSAKLLLSLRPWYPTESLIGLDTIGIENYEIFHHETAPLSELIRYTNYVVGCSTTVLIEGIINRKPVMNVTGYLDCGSYDFPEGLCAKARSDDIDAMVQGLADVVEKKDEMIELCNKHAWYYNYKDDGRAGERIAKDMAERIG